MKGIIKIIEPMYEIVQSNIQIITNSYIGMRSV